MHVRLPPRSPQDRVQSVFAAVLRSLNLSTLEPDAADGTLRLSAAAQRLYAAQQAEDHRQATPQAQALRAHVKTLDFHAVSSDEMTRLVGRLVDSGECSFQQVAEFFSIATSFEPPRSGDEKLDVVAHFDEQVKWLEREVGKDPNLEFGLRVAKRTVAVLRKVMSFGSSDRAHVMEAD